jgi:(p)ppGpp synthase/HD superfamily hydrolase
MRRLSEKVKDFAIRRHNWVRQEYGKGVPYSVHLEMVADFAEKFSYVLSEEDRDLAVAAAWGHDLIEDTRVTYNDLGKLFGWKFAEVVFCCTEQRGRNREERHGEAYYDLLSKNSIGKFVKLCDICANFSNSKENSNSMYKKYKKEFPKVKENYTKKVSTNLYGTFYILSKSRFFRLFLYPIVTTRLLDNRKQDLYG